MEDRWEEHTRKVSKLLEEDIPVLSIPNVAEYIFTGTDQEYWDLKRDFPNLAPPYGRFWAEHHIPTKLRSKEKGDSDMSDMVSKGRIGVLVTALDAQEANVPVGVDGIPKEAKWVLWCELFVDYGAKVGKKCTAEGSHGPVFVLVDAEGRSLVRPWLQSFSGGKFEDVLPSLISWIHPTFLAMSFLHCKNVRVVDNKVDVKLAKRYRERHGRSPVEYKTLVIEPLKEILRKEGRVSEVGLARALHICRGHFRDYREGRGLFGKYKQLVWTPMTVRGTKGKVQPPTVEVKI